MKTVWEKRPGRWKVSGETKTFSTKEKALEWASSLFEVVETSEEDAVWHNDIEIETPEEDIDPLEALKLARSKNGDISEGSHNDGDNEEQELSEGTD